MRGNIGMGSDQLRARSDNDSSSDGGSDGGSDQGIVPATLGTHKHQLFQQYSQHYPDQQQQQQQPSAHSLSALDARGDYDHMFFPSPPQTQQRQTQQQQQQQQPNHMPNHRNTSSTSLDNDNGDVNGNASCMPFPFYKQQNSHASPPPNGSLVALLHEHRSPDTALLERASLGGHGMFSRHQRSRSDSNDSTASLRANLNHNRVLDDSASQTSSHSLSPAPTPTPAMRQQHARASKAATAAIARVTTADAAGAGGSGSVKRSRYLREGDRRSIIHRIDRGEKQAALAKEFGVTRAAICHINKNRIEILTRSTRADVHAAARHPKRGLYNTSVSSSSAAALAASKAAQSALENQAAVLEVRSQPMAVLMTTLRRRETQARDFQVCADRAFRLLLEEALARVALRVIDVMTPSGDVCDGVAVDRPSCGVAVSEDGFALLQVFRSIQPASASGYITLNSGTTERDGNHAGPTLQHVCVPPDLRVHDVFLLEATCASSASACVAIQALLDLGAREHTIHFVCLLASAPAVAEMSSRFPRVRVVTGAIDPDVDDDGAICPGLGRFSERYFNTIVVRHSRDGADADV